MMPSCVCGHQFAQHDPIDENFAGGCAECDCEQYRPMTEYDREMLLEFRKQTLQMLEAARGIEASPAAPRELIDAAIELRERLEEAIVFTDYQLSEGGE